MGASAFTEGLTTWLKPVTLCNIEISKDCVIMSNRSQFVIIIISLISVLVLIGGL